MKALASKRVKGRIVYVIEGEVNKGDVLVIETEADSRVAVVTSKDTLSFAVERGGGQRGLIGQ